MNLDTRRVEKSYRKTKLVYIAVLLMASTSIFSGCGQVVSEIKNIEEPSVQEEDIQQVQEAEGSETAEVPSMTKMVLEPNSEIDLGGKTLSYEYVLDYEDNDEAGHGRFTYDGQEFESEVSMEYSCNSYVVDSGNGNFIIFHEMAYSNDWGETQTIVHHGNGEYETYGVLPESLSSIDDINLEDNTVVLHGRTDLFGTNGYKKTYLMADQGLEVQGDMIYFDNGKLYPEGDFFDGMDLSGREEMTSVYDEYGRRTLTTKQSLTLKTDDGDIIEVPEKTKLLVVGYASEEKKFYVELEGKEYYFEYEEDIENGWGHTVNGINESDMFVYIIYAG